MKETTITEPKLGRVMRGDVFHYPSDRMGRRYRLQRKGFFEELQRRDSRGEWVFDSFAHPKPATPDRLLLTGELGGQYVSAYIYMHLIQFDDE